MNFMKRDQLSAEARKANTDLTFSAKKKKLKRLKKKKPPLFIARSIDYKSTT